MDDMSACTAHPLAFFHYVPIAVVACCLSFQCMFCLHDPQQLIVGSNRCNHLGTYPLKPYLSVYLCPQRPENIKKEMSSSSSSSSEENPVFDLLHAFDDDDDEDQSNSETSVASAHSSKDEMDVEDEEEEAKQAGAEEEEEEAVVVVVPKKVKKPRRKKTTEKQKPNPRRQKKKVPKIPQKERLALARYRIPPAVKSQDGSKVSQVDQRIDFLRKQQGIYTPISGVTALAHETAKQFDPTPLTKHVCERKKRKRSKSKNPIKSGYNFSHNAKICLAIRHEHLATQLAAAADGFRRDHNKTTISLNHLKKGVKRFKRNCQQVTVVPI